MSWNVICDAESLDGETYTSPIISLRDKMENHSLEILTATGVGSIAITPYTSISGKSWKSEGEIITGFGKTSGPGSDGIQIFDLLLSPAESIYFSIVATGAITLSSWFTQK